MNSGLFPFELADATTRYLCLYMLTLAVHVVFMSYVFAGSGYLALCALLRRNTGPVCALLRDWLPFALGAAITAGVAPLLFLQILYQESFYTANLLLFHRFMAVVPVLIAGFYLLYVCKSGVLQRWPRWLGMAASVAAFACFAFTAYSWVEQHLLALDRSAWVPLYAAGRMHYATAESIPRTAFWFAFAVPMTALMMAWQVRRLPPADGDATGAQVSADNRTARRLALTAGLGLLASALAFIVYHALSERPIHGLGDSSAPYLYGVIAGALVQVAAWTAIWRSQALGRRALALASFGAGLSLVCVIAVRESVRVAEMPMEQLASIHERAAQAGGMSVFFVFAIVAVVLIAWCFRMTARALEPGA